MFGNGPSPVLRAIMLSIGAALTTYRIFNNGLIALLLGCGLGVLATALLMVDERNREAERAALWEERERRKGQADGEGR